jgi:DNA-binding Lrp family transcriptional regulator
MLELTVFEKALLDGWQRDFPLEARPYARIAAELGVSEGKVCTTLQSLKERGVLSRAGAVVQPNTAGCSTLVAMRVPEADLERVAAQISAEAAVNHNYQREHDFNLWFVVTANNRVGVRAIIERIEEKTGLEALDLPLEKAYHIDLGFRLWTQSAR